jgi:hypothetical protein
MISKRRNEGSNDHDDGRGLRAEPERRCGGRSGLKAADSWFGSQTLDEEFGMLAECNHAEHAHSKR